MFEGRKERGSPGTEHALKLNTKSNPYSKISSGNNSIIKKFIEWRLRHNKAKCPVHVCPASKNRSQRIHTHFVTCRLASSYWFVHSGAFASLFPYHLWLTSLKTYMPCLLKKQPYFRSVILHDTHSNCPKCIYTKYKYSLKRPIKLVNWNKLSWKRKKNILFTCSILSQFLFMRRIRF